MNKWIKIAAGCCVLFVCVWIVGAQEKTDTLKSKISLIKRLESDTTIYVYAVKNGSSQREQLELSLSPRGKKTVDLEPGDSVKISHICRSVRLKSRSGEDPVWLWTVADTKREWLKKHGPSEPGTAADDSEADEPDEPDEPDEVVPEVNREKPDAEAHARSVSARRVSEIVRLFRERLERDGYFSSDSISGMQRTIDTHVDCLNNWSSKEDYILGHGLEAYLAEAEREFLFRKEGSRYFVDTFLGNYEKLSDGDRRVSRDTLLQILDERLSAREEAIGRLRDAMNGRRGFWTSAWERLKSCDPVYLLNRCGIALVLLALAGWMVAAYRRKARTRKPEPSHSPSAPSDGSPSIVVRRRTTSILKKQSLEDVIDNGAYLKIDCNDFCADSHVRRIYIKNTCIKDVYNMYAEDLRNPDNPKEDGCMVLGRWVYDSETDEYYVSLEHIVLPGDDAVFSEYELNFGGKIKLRVAEKLRKLRRETNLQYDLTCWVHSHPGLGVFFSNSDSSVQMQLKHPTHPNFLTAIVVDILTPRQEFGIFTFKRDSTINSRQEMTRLYSLEELYRWAVESDRNSFRPEDHFNLLAAAENRQPSCYGVELSNGAIIDMCRLTEERRPGLAGWVQGYSWKEGLRTEYVVKAVSETETVPDNRLIGCFVVGTHCSIPTIRKACANYIDNISFVLFYSAATGVVTTIPVQEREYMTDERFYGENKLEELKIWTRRKR